MILMPLPHYGFDPTESAVPWSYLVERGVEVQFATPDGKVAKADKRLITGKGFGVFKSMLMAEPIALEHYQKMVASPSFQQPLKYEEIRVDEYDGILLPGGHDKGMRPYLESLILREKIAAFFIQTKLVGAICHGTIAAARTIDQQTGRSVLYEYQTTSLLKSQELGAYYLTKWWLHDYYRTYSETVEAEVRSVLKQPQQFQRGKLSLKRDSLSNAKPALVVKDRNYLSARWPGDAYTFAKMYYQELLMQLEK